MSLRTIDSALALAAGVILGLTTAFLAVHAEPPFGAVRSGSWSAWPSAGGPDPDPYARAVAARDGRIPLGSGAGLRFLAATDSEGQPLQGKCRYAVSGSPPAAQAWTVTVLDLAGFVPARPSGRTGFTSTELVRAIDGSFVVSLAAAAQPGNWLPVQANERFALMLSLYDTSLGTSLLMGGRLPALPAIARGRCG